MEHKHSLLYSQEPASSPCPEPDKSSKYPTHRISLKYILTLSSHLCLGFHSNLSPSDFPTKTLYALLFRACYMHYPSHHLWFNDSNDIQWGVHIIWFLIMQLAAVFH